MRNGSAAVVPNVCCSALCFYEIVFFLLLYSWLFFFTHSSGRGANPSSSKVRVAHFHRSYFVWRFRAVHEDTGVYCGVSALVMF